MKKYQNEIIKLTSKEIILSIFDMATPFFAASNIYRKSTEKYLKERSVEKSQFIEKLKYLKRKGYIETYVEGKEKFIELTEKGIDRAKLMKAYDIVISRPERWDGKWRIVIYDIPQKHNANRDRFRRKLIKLGLIKVQDSVYIYPFECTEEIMLLTTRLLISKYVLITISEIIQGETKLIEKFMDRKILNIQDLKSKESS